jgi:hypothetical protein
VRMVVLELMAAHEPRSGSDAWRPRT